MVLHRPAAIEPKQASRNAASTWCERHPATACKALWSARGWQEAACAATPIDHAAIAPLVRWPENPGRDVGGKSACGSWRDHAVWIIDGGASTDAIRFGAQRRFAG